MWLLFSGNRIVNVNGENVMDKSYSHVVQQIKRSGETLNLVVVPQEDDILQMVRKIFGNGLIITKRCFYTLSVRQIKRCVKESQVDDKLQMVKWKRPERSCLRAFYTGLTS